MAQVGSGFRVEAFEGSGSLHVKLQTLFDNLNGLEAFKGHGACTGLEAKTHQTSDEEWAQGPSCGRGLRIRGLGLGV